LRFITALSAVWLIIHVKHVGHGAGFRPKNPDNLFRLMDQLIGFTVVVGEIAENTNPSRTRCRTGRLALALGNTGVETEVALVNSPILFLEIPGIVRTGGHTGLTADAALVIHHDNAGFLVLVGCGGGTDPDTGRPIAMVAEHRHEHPLFHALADLPLLLENGGAVAIGRNVIGLHTGFHTPLTINTTILAYNHGIVRTVGETSGCRYRPHGALGVTDGGQGKHRPSDKNTGYRQTKAKESPPLLGRKVFSPLILEFFKIIYLHSLVSSMYFRRVLDLFHPSGIG